MLRVQLGSLVVGSVIVAAWLSLRRRKAISTTEEEADPMEQVRSVEQAVPVEKAGLAEAVEQLLRVVEFEGCGRCYVASRTIEGDTVFLREKPLLQTARATDDIIEQAELRLRAFCEASMEVQQRLLQHFCAPLEDIDTAAASTAPHRVKMRELLTMAERFVGEPWASTHSLDTLRRVLLASFLNSHSFENGTSAMFEHGCLCNHSCAANAAYYSDQGALCHVALRQIEAGEAVTTNYLGKDAAIATPMRQALLLVGKLFRCACTRCSGPDLVRAMPCLNCHSRPLAHSGGAGIAYVIPRPGTLELQAAPAVAAARTAPVVWKCDGCHTQWNDRQLQALSSGIGGGELEGGEFLLSNAVYRFVNERIDRPLGAFDSLQLQEMRRRYAATRGALGDRHWATAYLAKLLGHVLGAALASEDAAALERLGLTQASAAAEFSMLSDLCWQFCGKASLPPLLFTSLFCSDAIEPLTRSGVLTADVCAELFRRARAADVSRTRCFGSGTVRVPRGAGSPLTST